MNIVIVQTAGNTIWVQDTATKETYKLIPAAQLCQQWNEASRQWVPLAVAPKHLKAVLRQFATFKGATVLVLMQGIKEYYQDGRFDI